MSVLGSAMVCQPEIHKPNLATSQSPSKPFMSQGRLRGPTTMNPVALPGSDASARLVVTVEVTILVWQLAREFGGPQHWGWLCQG